MHLIHHDKEQQEISKFSVKFINYNPGDPWDADHVVRTIEDTEYREEVKNYLRQSPEGSMVFFSAKITLDPLTARILTFRGCIIKCPVLLFGYSSDTILDSFYRW